jgi:hypothetical protein
VWKNWLNAWKLLLSFFNLTEWMSGIRNQGDRFILLLCMGNPGNLTISYGCGGENSKTIICSVTLLETILCGGQYSFGPIYSKRMIIIFSKSFLLHASKLIGRYESALPASLPGLRIGMTLQNLLFSLGNFTIEQIW